LVLVAAFLTFLGIISGVQTHEGDHIVPSNVPGLYFDRIFIIFFENYGYSSVMRNAYFKQLTESGVNLANLYAISHPSQPNYIAFAAGDTLGVTSNDPINLAYTSIVDLLENSSISWKAYVENLPSPCFTGQYNDGTLYARKHNPFISFNSVRNNATRCAKIVPSAQLDIDIAGDRLPQFSYYIPNQRNDAHDTSVAFGADWLRGFLAPKQSNPNFSRDTLVVVTWDEDDYLENNHIHTALLGPLVKSNVVDNTRYSLYSIIATVEKNWGLKTLGRGDATANAFAASNYVPKAI